MSHPWIEHLRHKAGRLRSILTEQGVGAALQEVIRTVLRRQPERPAERYQFVLKNPVGRALADASQAPARTINWVLVGFDAGSGGHTTIFRMVYRLQQAGFVNRLVIVDGRYFRSAASFRELLHRSYAPIDAEIFLDVREAPPAWCTVATAWNTAYAVRDFLPTWRRAYIVQDYEPWFSAVGTEAALAEATYRMGFHGITAGSWLAELLKTQFGMPTTPFGFGVDHDLYFPRQSPEAQTDTVFFYARPATARRAFEFGVLVLREVVRRRPQTKIVLAGADLAGYEIPFAHRSEGVVTPARLGELYRESEVALLLSLTNASLVPLECMACGTVVVSNGGPNVEWLLDSSIADIRPCTIESMADGVVELLDDPVRRGRLREAGYRRAKAASWEVEADKVVAAFEALATQDRTAGSETVEARREAVTTP